LLITEYGKEINRKSITIVFLQTIILAILVQWGRQVSFIGLYRPFFCSTNWWFKENYSQEFLPLYINYYYDCTAWEKKEFYGNRGVDYPGLLG
jgi:hypothetical protein